MSEPEWLMRAVPANDVVIDFGYLIHDSYYYGPENEYLDKRQTHSEKLEPIAIERYGDFVLSGSIGDSLGELTAYYLRITRLALLHQKNILRQYSYFWLRPLIFSRGAFMMTFPWYDTLQEAEPLLTALASHDEGLILDDQEQGWQFEAFVRGDAIFLRESNPDDNEEHFVIVASRSVLRDQVVPLQQRVVSQVSEMTKVVGRNFWARHPK